MLKNIHGVESIVEFYKEWLEKPNGKYQLARIFGMAQRYEEIQEKESEIEKLLNLSKGERAVETTIINKVIAIVEVESTKRSSKKTYYQSVVNGKRINEVADTFDYALAIALGQKYEVSSYAPQAIRNILQMDEYEKSNRPKTFIEKVSLGEMTIDHLEDVIKEWHEDESLEMELHEYLGLTLYEYQEAVMHNKKDVLQNIIELHNHHNKK
jgi:hypothetical protein